MVYSLSIEDICLTMRYIAVIGKGGMVIEVEFFEAGNMADARITALNIAIAESGILLNVRLA